MGSDREPTPRAPHGPAHIHDGQGSVPSIERHPSDPFVMLVEAPLTSCAGKPSTTITSMAANRLLG
jgi:hypothetical protein